MQNDLKLLIEMLWKKNQHLDMNRLCELITNPSLLHDATKSASCDHDPSWLLTRSHILFRLDVDGHTLLHTIVTRQRVNMHPQVEHTKQANNFKVLDKDKNNLLRYAKKLVEKDVDLWAL